MTVTPQPLPQPLPLPLPVPQPLTAPLPPALTPVPAPALFGTMAAAPLLRVSEGYLPTGQPLEPAPAPAGQPAQSARPSMPSVPSMQPSMPSIHPPFQPAPFPSFPPPPGGAAGGHEPALTLVDTLPSEPERVVAPVLRRVGFTFSSDGGYAACLATSGDSGWYPESWWLGGAGGPEPMPLLSGGVPGGATGPESLHSQLVSLQDGRVLICRQQQEAQAPQGGVRQDLLVRTPGRPGEQLVGSLRVPALRLLALPSAGFGAPVAVALGADQRQITSAWLISADGAPPQQVAEFSGQVGGGVWLDRGGRMLALDHVRPGEHGPLVKTVVLDLATGVLSPLLELAPGSNDRLVLADPVSGLILVRSDAPGVDRLGWGVLGGEQPLRFPDCLHPPQRFLRPVAIEAATDPGTPAAELRVALQGDWGVASSLTVWSPGEGRCEPVAIPSGRLGGVGHWSAAGLRMPYSAPDHPAGMATIDVDLLTGEQPQPQVVAPTMPLRLAPLQGGRAGVHSLLRTVPDPSTVRQLRPNRPGWRLDGSSPPGGGGRWQPARTVELAGAAGPVEAVVYGGDAWLTAQHLVLALHGGPADAWRMEFDPTLQRMAAEGLAVVAPNQRGSTGYGIEHAQAVQGAWGGPDLDDVLTLLSSVSGQRVASGLEPASLFGVSYGAFLALLAASTSPHLVARCAVVAPFLSGARLLAEATPGVRSLTVRMGGAQEPEDGRGPRDVLRLCHRLVAPLLVVHGDQDDVVPVGQSRTLRQELLRMGRREGADLRLVEVAGAGHEVLAEESGPVLHELLAGFLRTGRTG